MLRAENKKFGGFGFLLLNANKKGRSIINQWNALFVALSS